MIVVEERRAHAARGEGGRGRRATPITFALSGAVVRRWWAAFLGGWAFGRGDYRGKRASMAAAIVASWATVAVRASMRVSGDEASMATAAARTAWLSRWHHG